MHTTEQKRKIVGRNGLYPPKEYQSAHLYIVDDIDPNAPPARVRKRRRLDAHTHKCNTIREFFQNYTNCEVHSVRFPQGTRGTAFFDYWREELAAKTKDDILIIYFHGSAGGEEKEYKWSLSQYPKIQINAYQLIRMVTKSEPDSYFLLDCFIHTRISHKWRRATGNTEISARPERMQHPDGRPIDHDGEFTESLVENLEYFVDEIKGDWRNYKQMLSIPDIMRSDETMPSNPLRIWLNRTKFGDKKQVKRFRIDPKRVRRDGRIEFLTVVMQGPPEDEIMEMLRVMAEERRAAVEGDGEGSDFDDEGFEDGDDDGDDEDDDGDGDGDGSGTGGGNGGTEVEVDEGSSNDNTNTGDQDNGLFVTD